MDTPATTSTEIRTSWAGCLLAAIQGAKDGKPVQSDDDPKTRTLGIRVGDTRYCTSVFRVKERDFTDTEEQRDEIRRALGFPEGADWYDVSVALCDNIRTPAERQKMAERCVEIGQVLGSR